MTLIPLLHHYWWVALLLGTILALVGAIMAMIEIWIDDRRQIAWLSDPNQDWTKEPKKTSIKPVVVLAILAAGLMILSVVFQLI